MPASLSALEPLPLAAPPSAQKREALIVARWPVGGIRMHLKYNHPALEAAGYHCTLVVPDDGNLPTLRETLPGALFLPVPVSGRKCPIGWTVREAVRTGRFSLVHAHGLTAAAHASLACVAQPTPLVVTLHEPVREAQFPGFLGHGKRWLLGHALARAAAIVTVGEDARANLLHHFPNLRRRAARVHTIPNGIDVARYAEIPPADSDLREELGIDDRTVLFGYLGRFMPEKGFGLLIEAVSRLVQFGGVDPFHVVAFGSSDYRREYAAQIEQKGLAGHMTLREFIPNVRPVLEQLDMVVVPSLWEASPLTPMEALSAGVPVLGSDCQGLREVLRGTPSRTFRAGVPAALETALREALASPWYEAAGRYAPLARRRFDNRHSARRLVDLYNEVQR